MQESVKSREESIEQLRNQNLRKQHQFEDKLDSVRIRMTTLIEKNKASSEEMIKSLAHNVSSKLSKLSEVLSEDNDYLYSEIKQLSKNCHEDLVTVQNEQSVLINEQNLEITVLVDNVEEHKAELRILADKFKENNELLDNELLGKFKDYHDYTQLKYKENKEERIKFEEQVLNFVGESLDG